MRGFNNFTMDRQVTSRAKPSPYPILMFNRGAGVTTTTKTRMIAPVFIAEWA